MALYKEVWLQIMACEGNLIFLCSIILPALNSVNDTFVHLPTGVLKPTLEVTLHSSEAVSNIHQNTH